MIWRRRGKNFCSGAPDGSIVSLLMQMYAVLSELGGSDTNEMHTDKSEHHLGLNLYIKKKTLAALAVVALQSRAVQKKTPIKLRWTISRRCINIFSIKTLSHALQWPTSTCVYKTRREESCPLRCEGTEWKIPPSVAKQTARGPEDAWTNLALFRRITALSEESLGSGGHGRTCKSTSWKQWHSSERRNAKFREEKWFVGTRSEVSESSIKQTYKKKRKKERRLKSSLCFPAGWFWPSALCECFTNSEGQTWSGCITLFCMMALRLTLEPLIIAQSCCFFIHPSSSTLRVNLHKISQKHFTLLHAVNKLKVEPKFVAFKF